MTLNADYVCCHTWKQAIDRHRGLEADVAYWRKRATFYEAELERIWEQLTMAYDERDDARRERNILERQLHNDGEA